MTREELIKLAREAGWSGILTQWAEPTGEPGWSPVKESLTVPVTMAQIERFAELVAAAERERILAIAQSRYDYEVKGAAHHAGRWNEAFDYHMTRQAAMSDLLGAIALLGVTAINPASRPRPPCPADSRRK